MITQQELNALVELLNRVPMSVAEKLWTQNIINKLSASIAEESEPIDLQDAETIEHPSNRDE